MTESEWLRHLLRFYDSLDHYVPGCSQTKTHALPFGQFQQPESKAFLAFRHCD